MIKKKPVKKGSFLNVLKVPKNKINLASETGNHLGSNLNQTRNSNLIMNTYNAGGSDFKSIAKHVHKNRNSFGQEILA